MKNDLMQAWKLYEDDSSDMTYLDNIVDDNEETLKVALAYMQLYKYYFQTHGGIDSKTYLRMQEYYGLYQTEAQKFPRLKSDDITTTKTTYYLRG